MPLPPRRVSGPRTAADAARSLGVELRVVQRALRKGYLQGEKRGNAWLIPEAVLVELASAGPGPFPGTATSHPAAWMPGFISAADAARELGVTAGYVGTLVRRGRLEARRVGVWLAVSETSVARFAERRRPAEENPASGEIRRLILDGTCPWCGRVNLLVPARHVTSRHGIDRRELRRLMGVRARTPICAPERRRQRNLRPERLAQLRTLTPWKETTGTRLTGSDNPPFRRSSGGRPIVDGSPSPADRLSPEGAHRLPPASRADLPGDRR